MTKSKPQLTAGATTIRKAGVAVLVTGGVLSIAAAFGPIWFVRAGVAVALLSGLVACVLAWRESKIARVQAGADVVEVMARSAEATSGERVQHLEVLGTIEDRNAALRSQLRELRIKHADRLIELNALRGDKSALSDEVAQAAGEIADLRARLADLETALARGEDETAEVLLLPRRAGRPGSDDTIERDLFPTVIDLQAFATPLVEEVRREHA